jgi:hypothetical protein
MTDWRDRPSSLRGLRETQIEVRNHMPDESPIDLDEHARLIAEVCLRARVRGQCARVSALASANGRRQDRVAEQVEQVDHSKGVIARVGLLLVRQLEGRA